MARNWSIATTLKISVVATVSTCSAGSKAIGSTRLRRAKSCVTSLSASGSATTCARSLDSWPMVRAMMSRMSFPCRPAAPAAPMGTLLCAARRRDGELIGGHPADRSSPRRSFFLFSPLPGLAGPLGTILPAGELADAIVDLAVLKLARLWRRRLAPRAVKPRQLVWLTCSVRPRCYSVIGWPPRRCLDVAFCADSHCAWSRTGLPA